MRGVGVQDFPPIPSEWHSDAIVAPNLRCEIDRYQTAGPRIFALAQPCKNAAVRIVSYQPFEAGGITVAFVKRGKRSIEVVQIAHQALYASVLGAVEQMPGKAVVVVPLGVLRKL